MDGLIAMQQRHSTAMQVFEAAIPSPGERRLAGKERRIAVPRSIQAVWDPPADRPPVELVRQLSDAKWSADVTIMGPSAFALDAGHCGWALARAHARTGDSVAISGYLGRSDRFGQCIADWAEVYADQTERDHAALVAAIERGVLPTSERD